MTDPMELAGRLENWPLHKDGADLSCKAISAQMEEAAACIREMVDKIASMDEQIDSLSSELCDAYTD